MSFEYWWAEEPRTTSEEALRHYFEECWGYAIEESAKLCESQIDLEYATGKVDHNEMAWCMKLAMDIRKLKAPNVEFSGTPAALSPEAPLERRVGGAVPPAPTFGETT